MTICVSVAKLWLGEFEDLSLFLGCVGMDFEKGRKKRKEIMPFLLSSNS